MDVLHWLWESLRVRLLLLLWHERRRGERRVASRATIPSKCVSTERNMTCWARESSLGGAFLEWLDPELSRRQVLTVAVHHYRYTSFQRKKTLLLEYQSRHKTGKFIDQRFGEYNEDLTLEEKVARRFLMERKVKG